MGETDGNGVGDGFQRTGAGCSRGDRDGGGTGDGHPDPEAYEDNDFGAGDGDIAGNGSTGGSYEPDARTSSQENQIGDGSWYQEITMPEIDGNGHGSGEGQYHYFPKGIGFDFDIGNIFGNGRWPSSSGGAGPGFYDGDGGRQEYSAYVRTGRIL